MIELARRLCRQATPSDQVASSAGTRHFRTAAVRLAPAEQPAQLLSEPVSSLFCSVAGGDSVCGVVVSTVAGDAAWRVRRDVRVVLLATRGFAVLLLAVAVLRVAPVVLRGRRVAVLLAAAALRVVRVVLVAPVPDLRAPVRLAAVLPAPALLTPALLTPVLLTPVLLTPVLVAPLPPAAALRVRVPALLVAVLLVALLLVAVLPAVLRVAVPRRVLVALLLAAVVLTAVLRAAVFVPRDVALLALVPAVRGLAAVDRFVVDEPAVFAVPRRVAEAVRVAAVRVAAVRAVDVLRVVALRPAAPGVRFAAAFVAGVFGVVALVARVVRRVAVAAVFDAVPAPVFGDFAFAVLGAAVFAVALLAAVVVLAVVVLAAVVLPVARRVAGLVDAAALLRAVRPVALLRDAVLRVEPEVFVVLRTANGCAPCCVSLVKSTLLCSGSRCPVS